MILEFLLECFLDAWREISQTDLRDSEKDDIMILHVS